MTRLLHRPKRDEDVLLAACATSRPSPIATTLPPLPLGAPARAHAVLLDLRAADSGLGMRRPSAPGPRLSQRTLALRSLSELVAIVTVYDHVANEIDAAIAELMALAPYTAKAEVA